MDRADPDSNTNPNPGQLEMNCSICHKKLKGAGNNAKPVNDGRCCDRCDNEVVTPARIRLAGFNIPDDFGQKLNEMTEKFRVTLQQLNR